jgi:amino acid transporter
MYTYVARGLGSFAGWLMAWAFLLAEPIVPAALYASFGLFGASFISTLTGYTNDLLWLPLAVICGLIVWLLVYRGISISTRVGVALGLIEIGIFLLISLLLVVNAGSRNTLSVFIPGDEGILPALQGMVFCLLAFVGFEAAKASVVKMGGLTFETLLVGHGEPILQGASGQVAALAAGS